MNSISWAARLARCLLVLCAFVLCLATFVPAAFSVVSAASRPTATTLELINQAFARHEITGDQRLTYLTYAVYDLSRLPARFLGRPGWSATLVLREINRARQALASGRAALSPALRSALQSSTIQGATVCDAQDGPSTKDTAHFHIVYGSINTLTVQQYADALEATFNMEITTNGWAKPPLSDNNPFGLYPVQIADLGPQLYGHVVSPGGSYTGDVGDNPNTAATETSALATCMVVNSDMLQLTNNDPQAALLALKVTAAHEYFHAVQFGTGDPSPEEELMWLESTAAYVEDEVLPTVHDNYQYLYPDLTVSLPQHAGDNVYAMWPLFRYAAERNGGLQSAGGTSLMKSLWAGVAAGQPAITAYDNALKAKGTTLNETFHRFAISLRFMKGCATAAPYCFSDAAGILTRQGSTPANQGDIAAIGQSYNGSLVNTYAADWVGLPASGTYAVQVNNTSANGQLHASIVAEVGDTLVVSSLAGVAGPNGTSSLMSYTVPDGASSVVLVITNQQVSTDVNSIVASSYQVSTGAAAELDQITFLPLTSN